MPAATLLAPGNTELTSATFTVVNGSPATLVAYSGDSSPIEYPGKVILQRKKMLDVFENFSTVYDGNILFKEDSKSYNVDIPGVYRVYRPDLSQFTNLSVGVEITDDSLID